MKLSQSVFQRLLLSLVFIAFTFSFGKAFAETASQQEKPLEAVSLQLKWLHQFQFAGYYAAKIKGFYAEEGLDVTIKQRDMFANNIEQVINGESEYGIADSMLMLYQAKGAPVTIVSAIFQHSPQVFLSLSSSGIQSPFDMKDKNVAFYQRDTDGFPLLAMLHENGINFNANRMVIKAGPEILAKKQVDVYPAYLSNEPYYFYERNIPINVINPLNFGVDFYGDLIFTHNQELKNHPERVEAFRKASIKGWKYALEHKEELINYIINELKVDKTFDHLMYEAKAIESAIQPNSVPIGTLNEGRLQFINRLFEKHNLVKKNRKLSDGIYRPEQHKLNLSRTEKAWIKRNQEIKVAIDQAWRPIEYLDENGQYNGIVKGFLDHLSALTGLQFRPQTTLDWNESVEAVKKGEIAMFSAVIETPERRKFANFTPSYLNFPMVIATQKGENYIPNFNELRNKTVAVVENYAAHELIVKQYPHLGILLVSSVEEGLKAVSKGEAYGYIDNLAVVGYHIRNQGLSNLQISGETDFDANIKMAVNKEFPELHSILTKALSTIDNETRLKLSNSWLQIEYKQELNWQEIGLYLTPALIIILIVLFYGQKMRLLNKTLSQTNAALVETQASLEANKNRLEVLSVTDFLTGAYNRQHLDMVLENEINRAQRHESSFSILLIDLDNFKQVNDTYGHLTGDEVLKRAFDCVSEQVRRSDTVGRWGGEEFIVICPETDKHQALTIAEKILLSISTLKFDQGFQQTTSIGIAQYSQMDSSVTLIDRADQNLYKAKHSGKNQAVL